jgi:hypothetical protein
LLVGPDEPLQVGVVRPSEPYLLAPGRGYYRGVEAWVRAGEDTLLPGDELTDTALVLLRQVG